MENFMAEMHLLEIPNRMVEVFKTNVDAPQAAADMIKVLCRQFPESRINFDLHDCDKVLRVEGNDFTPEAVMLLLGNHGFECRVLE